MVVSDWPHCRLFTLAALVSFCSNWQFAFQITYVNTSVTSFYNLANKGFRAVRGCHLCWLPEQSWSSAWSAIVTSFYPGAIVGFLVVPWLVSRIGVKKSQIVMCLAAIIGCFVHYIAILVINDGEIIISTILSVGRFLIGIQGGSSLCLLPLYMMEISPREHRPFLNTFQQISQALGTLLGLLIGAETFIPLGENRFAWLQVFAVAPTVCFVVILLVTPATPRQLLKERSHTIDVVESLQYYYGSHYCIDSLREEWNTSSNDNSSKKFFSGKSNGFSSWKGFLIGCAAAASYAFTGDDLIDTFSSQMLTTMPGVSDVSTDLADIISVIMGLVLVIASIGGAFLIDRFGRRRLIIFGLFGCSVSNLLLVLFPTSVKMATISFTLTKAFIGLGAGAPAWFLTTELVPPSCVSVFQSFSTGVLLITTMLVTFFYLRLEYAIHQYSILLLTTAPATALAVILLLFLPETRNRTNSEIQELLDSTISGFAKVQKSRKSRLISTSSYGSI